MKELFSFFEKQKPETRKPTSPKSELETRKQEEEKVKKEILEEILILFKIEFVKISLTGRVDGVKLGKLLNICLGEGGIFYNFFRKIIEKNSAQIFNRTTRHKNLIELKQVLYDSVNSQIFDNNRGLISTWDIGQLADSINNEFNKPDFENYLLNEENIKNPSSRLYEILTQRFHEDTKLATKYSQEIADQEPEIFIPQKSYKYNNGSTVNVSVYNNTEPVNVFEIGIKNSTCIGYSSQDYMKNVLTRKGEYAPRNIILSVEVNLDHANPIGRVSKLENWNLAPEVLANQQAYRHIKTYRWPRIVLELQVLNAAKPNAKEKLILRFGQVRFASNEIPNMQDGFSYEIFAKQILPEIYAKLISQGHEVRGFGRDLINLRQANKFLTVKGNDLTMHEILENKKDEIIVAGPEITPTVEELGQDKEEQIKNLQRLCQLENTIINLDNIANRQYLLDSIVTSRGGFRSLKSAEISLPNLEKTSGSLIILNAQKANFPKLKHIGQSLSAPGNTIISVPELVEVGEHLNLEGSKGFQAPKLKDVNGNFYLANARNIYLENLRQVKNIVNLFKAENINLPNLLEVGGNIFGEEYNNIELPKLKILEGSLILRNGQNFYTDSLITVGNSVEIFNSSNIFLPKLKKVYNELSAISCHLLEMHGIENVGGNFKFQNAGKAIFPHLLGVSKAIAIFDSEQFIAPRLEFVGTTLNLGDVSSLIIPKLVEAKEIFVDPDNLRNVFVNEAIKNKTIITLDGANIIKFTDAMKEIRRMRGFFMPKRLRVRYV